MAVLLSMLKEIKFRNSILVPKVKLKQAAWQVEIECRIMVIHASMLNIYLGF